MATVKVSVAMQKQILELHLKGYKERKIARTLKVGRGTVKRVIERGDLQMPGVALPEWARCIDWEKVRLEASRGVQLNILAREHAGEKISYVQFWRQFYKTYPAVPTVTMRLEHKPAEKTFFDYADGIDIVNRDTGEVTNTSLMCGVIAMSSYTYGEFTLTQKRDDLLRAMENAFRYFGGVTPYVTVDNQKAAVNKAHWYDPDLNPAFVDFANHWGFAVLPARPSRPQDKAGNECGIGVIQRQFFQEVRGKTFYSLDELNQAFRKYLERLNQAVMKDWGVSRTERFEGERELLKPCPLQNWEVAEWKTAKVHADCHVQVMKKFYSVPYKYVGLEVRVKVTARMIEIFDRDLNPLSAHARLVAREIYSTDKRHYPQEKVALTQFSVQQALKGAERVGAETFKLVGHLLNGEYPLKYLRRVQGILRLHQSARVSREALEYACKMGMLYSKTQYTYLQNTAQYFDKNGNKPSIVRTAPQRDATSMYLHNSFEREEL
jgi:Integrase core domain